MGPITTITVHHTAGPCFWETSTAATATLIRNIQKFHQNERRWADIGYHYVIDRVGNIWQGRSLQYQGAHAGGSLNEGNIGGAVLGNFCVQKPTAAQYSSLALLVETLCMHLRLSPGRVFTHAEIADTANLTTRCPGPALTRCVQAIRSRLQRRLLAYRSGPGQ